MRRYVIMFVAMYIASLPSYVVAQEHVIVNFDNVASLSEYASWGLTFTDVSIWAVGQHPSLSETEDGGALSMPNGICASACYNGTGSIFFDAVMIIDTISIWALSGPGPDLLSSNVRIEAFDNDGNSLGTAVVSGTLQYEQLTISATGIRRLDLTCGSKGDAWDDLELIGAYVIGTEESSLGAIKQLHK